MTADGVFVLAGKILIVDDVATNRIVLKVKLASAYYETIQAATAAEALALAQTERPDLILLDIELPDLSGIDVCARLKADPRTSNIPVVMIARPKLLPATEAQTVGRAIAALHLERP